MEQRQLWYQHAVTKARHRRQRAPFDNIYIGTDPTDGYTQEDANFFDVILNVSDSECAFFNPSRPDQKHYWFPINEAGYWSYAAFYFTKKVLDFHYEQGHKILCHCHAGAHRSPTIFIWWLVSRGHPLREAALMEYAGNCTEKSYQKLREGFHKTSILACMYSDIKQGHVPKHLTKMYERMQKNPNWGLASCIFYPDILEESIECLSLDSLKAHKHYRRFRWFYWLKYRLKDYIEWLTLTLRGRCRVKLGNGMSVTCKRRDRADVLKKHREQAQCKIKNNLHCLEKS